MAKFLKSYCGRRIEKTGSVFPEKQKILPKCDVETKLDKFSVAPRGELG